MCFEAAMQLRVEATLIFEQKTVKNKKYFGFAMQIRASLQLHLLRYCDLQHGEGVGQSDFYAEA